MANVKITALEHLSSTQLAPEDVFVIDDVSVLVTRKITTSNVTRYISNVIGNAKIVENNLISYANYANANAAALAVAIANVSTNFSIAGDSGTDSVLVGAETLTFRGSQGINTAVQSNELIVRLANTRVVAGLYGGSIGSTSYIPTITVDAQGRITAVQNTAVTVDFAAVYSNISLVQDNVTALSLSTNVAVSQVESNAAIAIANTASNLTSAINDVQSNVTAVETRRDANLFYSYNTHSVISTANVLPSVDNALTLGAPDLRWAEVYVGPGSLHIGNLNLSVAGPSAIKLIDSTGAFTIIDTSIANISAAISNVSSNSVSLSSSIGDLQQLSTTAKSNLVAAINETMLNSNVNIGSFNFLTQTTNSVSTIGAVVYSENKDQSRFAKLLINVEDLTYGQYQSSEVLLVQDGNSVRMVEYAIIYTSSQPIVTYEAQIVGANVEIFATATSADNRIKVLKLLN